VSLIFILNHLRLYGQSQGKLTMNMFWTGSTPRPQWQQDRRWRFKLFGQKFGSNHRTKSVWM